MEIAKLQRQKKTMHWLKIMNKIHEYSVQINVNNVFHLHAAQFIRIYVDGSRVLDYSLYICLLTSPILWSIA